METLNRNRKNFGRLPLKLIALVGVIVPRRLRADWRQEWEAELRHRETLLAEWDKLDWKHKLDLLRRSLGAFWDALLLQPRRMEDEMFQDLRFGARMLLKSKSFTLMAVLTLTLGIGANTAIFSVVNALLLKPLPYTHAERLVWIEEADPQATARIVPGADFLDWRERSQLLESIAAYSEEAATLTGAGEPERLEGYRVSDSFFPTLGAPLLLGRNFLPEEDRAGGERVVILSHSLWQRRFSADQGIVGKAVRLDEEGYRVVGVMRPDFRFFLKSEFWLPLAFDAQQEQGNQMTSFAHVFARLKPGVTQAQAQAELETIKQAQAGAADKEKLFSQARVQFTPLHQQLADGVRHLLLILWGAVALVLLMACANVANLMLARAVTRQKELAIRAALGAGRLRLLRQMLTESLLLAGAGGLCGWALAWWLTRLLVWLSPAEAFGQIGQLAAIRLDGRVLGFTLLTAWLSSVLIGLAPALQGSQPDLNVTLKESGRGGLLQRQRLRQALLVGEVALAVVLLAGAGLLLRSFVNLLNVEPGFQAENLLTARVVLPYLRYKDQAKRKQFEQQVLERLAATPGIEHVGAINHLPVTDFSLMVWLRAQGRPPEEGQKLGATPLGLISPDYFRTLGIGLRAGRYFDERDTAEAPRVLILSEMLARQLFPNEDPLGKRIHVPGPPGPNKELPVVVGVVGDVRHQGLEQAVRAQVFAPFTQFASTRMVLAVRTAGEPQSMAAALRAAVLATDPEAPVYEVMTMEERLRDSVAARRFILLLVGLFALLALALAAVGVYGVLAYAVTQRTHEVGIRMALGAEGRDVARLFLKQGMALVVCGVMIGLLGAFGLTRVMAGLLFGVKATDPLTFTGVAFLLTLVALAACWLPARRATRVDPLVALRHE